MSFGNYQANNKRVAKNTLLLYIRMLILLGVGLFTSRVVLRTLGVENYGIHSVIAGFLSMFSILTSSMSSAISRFITVELGRGEREELEKVFSTSVLVQIFMGLMLFIAIETIGLWFLTRKMNIPVGREEASQWCLHCAAATTFVNLLNVPFIAEIIAHERMTAFAYMSILEAIFKLLICYALYISMFDKLKTYSVLLVLVAISIRMGYYAYCHVNFKECRARLRFHKRIFFEMWSFAGWSFLGNSAGILNSQGINMLMNIFFGVVVNAARGIAEQVNGVIQYFVSNFMMALNPQITKLYSTGNKEYAFQLACRGARFSFFMMHILALPIMIEARQVLTLWLGKPPEQAPVFFVLTVVSTLIHLLGGTLVTLQMAHGEIRKYQIWITIFGFLAFPLTYIAFKIGCSPVVAYFIYIAVYWLLLFVRFHLVHASTGIPGKDYLYGVVFKCHIIGLASAITPIAVHFFMPSSFLRFCSVAITSFLSSVFFIYCFGINAEEKALLLNFVSSLKDKVLTFKN